jgi:hypothetical protein
MTEAKKLFIIGCPRSGTTWVQLLLSQHPLVATAPETQIFAYYLDQLHRQWQHEDKGAEREQGRAGLSRLLSQAEFEGMCRTTAMVVLDKIASSNPDARVIVEKSPKHALSAAFIQRVFPEAFFLNVIRDPRDTVASLLAAGRSWGDDWAPRNAIDGSRLWVESVLRAREASARPAQYLEVHYETLRANPVPQLSDVFSWLGVPMSEEDCAAAVAACDLKQLQKTGNESKLPVPGARSPAGFFRKGVVGGWSKDLSRNEAAIVEYICGDLMDELGYARTSGSPALAARVGAHDALQRVRESIDWQLQRLLTRI